MPQIARFFGIVVFLYFEKKSKHKLPHVHATYGDYKVSMALDGTVLSGKFPPKQLRTLKLFVIENEAEIESAWNKSVSGEPFDVIEDD